MEHKKVSTPQDGVRYLLNSVAIVLENLGHASQANDIRMVKDGLLTEQMSYERAAGDIVLAIILAANRPPDSMVVPPSSLPMID